MAKKETKFFKFCPSCGSINIGFTDKIAQNAILMHVNYVCKKCNSEFTTPFEGDEEFIKEYKENLQGKKDSGKRVPK